MKIDLCKLFGVEEGEEFKVDRGVNYPRNNTYFVKNNILLYKNEQAGVVIEESNLGINNLNQIKEIIKLPKKKQFSQDTLNFFKCIDKKYEWIARDEDGEVWLFKNKPKKIADGIWDATGDDFESATLVNLLLFKEILWEDEEPVYIDDYVER